MHLHSLPVILPNVLKRFLTVYLSLWLTLSPLLSYGDVQGDGSTNTGVDRAPNGVEVVNIARQNQHGVSINNYQRFNVAPSGLILNNSDRVANSQLGGALYANPNFQTGDGANLILNQVTGDKISHLLGYTEIFGKKAAFVLANPNGIYAKGAGFINTNDVSLITGVAKLNNGYPDRYTIGQGKLLIEGTGQSNLGIDARGANYLRLISRLQSINGDIHAGKQIDIQAGNGDYDYDKHLINSLSKSSEDKIAIAAMGSMYGDNIKLISTEEGLGVKLDNSLIANAGNISLTSAGELIYKKALAKGNIDLRAKAITQQKNGQSYAKEGNISLKAKGNIHLHGQMLTSHTLSIQSDHLITHKLTSSNTIGLIAKSLHINANHSTLASTLQSQQFTLTGKYAHLAADDIQSHSTTIAVDRLINHSQLRGNYLHIRSRQGDDSNTLINHSTIHFSVADIQSAALHNQAQALIYATDQLTLKHSTHNANLLKGILRADKSLHVELSHGVSLSQENLTIIGGRDTNTYSIAGDVNLVEDLSSRGNLNLTAHNLNTQGNMLAVEGHFNLQAKGLTNHQRGYVYSGGMMALDVDELTNEAGATLYAGGDLSIHKNNARNTRITNRAGHIQSRGAMSLKTKHLTNSYVGNLVKKTWENKTIGYRYFYDNDTGQKTSIKWKSKTESLFTEQEASYDRGKLVSQGNMMIDSAQVDNQYSIIRSNSNLVMHNVGNIINHSKELKEEYWHKEGRTATDHYSYYGGWLDCCKKHTSRQVAYDFVEKRNRNRNIKIGGTISAAGQMTGVAQSINNGITLHKDTVASTQRGNFQVSAIKTSGKVSVFDALGGGDNPLAQLNGAFQLASATNPNSLYLIESRTRFTDQKQFVASAYFLKHMGFDPKEADVSIFADGWSEQQLIAQSIAKITHKPYLAPTITSMDEQMKSLYDNALALAKGLNLKVGAKLTQAQIAALDKDIIWYEKKQINGKDVLVPQLYLAQSTRNRIKIQGGALLAADDIDLKVAGNVQNSGSISAQNTLKLNVTGDIQNNDGNIESGGDMNLQATNVLNQTHRNSTSWFSGQREEKAQAGIRSGGNLTLTAKERIDNIGGVIQATGDATLKGKTITNQSTVSGYDNGAFARSGLDGLATIQTGGNLITQGGSFTDTGGKIKTGKHWQSKLEGNMTFNSIAMKTSNFSNENGWEVQRHRRDHHVSQVNVGGSLQWQAGRDIHLKGTQMTIQDKGVIVAGGNYTQQSVINSTSEERKKFTSSSGGFLGGSESEEKTETKNSATHQASQINTGGGLHIQSGGNLNLIASRLENQQGDLTLKAGNDLNLISGVNQQSESYRREKKDTWSDIKSGSQKSRQTIAHTSINNTGDTHLSAENDVNLMAIKANADKLKINATQGDIHLKALKTTQSKSKYRNDSGMAMVSMQDKGKVNEHLHLSQLTGTMDINAGKNIHIDTDGNNSTHNSKDSSSKDTNTHYLSLLRNHSNAQFHTLHMNNKNWNNKSSSLSGVASLALAITAAALTGGAGAAIAGNGIAGAVASGGISAAAGTAAVQAGNVIVDNNIHRADITAITHSSLKGGLTGGITYGANSAFAVDVTKYQGLTDNTAAYASNAIVRGMGQVTVAGLTGDNLNDAFKNGFISSLVQDGVADYADLPAETEVPTGEEKAYWKKDGVHTNVAKDQTHTGVAHIAKDDKWVGKPVTTKINKEGQLRIVDPMTKKPLNNRQLSWSDEGSKQMKWVNQMIGKLYGNAHDKWVTAIGSQSKLMTIGTNIPLVPLYYNLTKYTNPAAFNLRLTIEAAKKAQEDQK